MQLFPAFIKLAGRTCLVVGAGRVAQEKIEGLLFAEANVRVVAPRATSQIKSLARAGKISWHTRRYRSSDLRGAFLVIAATSSRTLHAQIYREANRRGVLCNVVDDPEHCDFYYGSVVRRGSLQIAISTGGQSPALAQRLRKQLGRRFGAEYEHWLEALGAARKKLFQKSIAPKRRKAMLHRLASEFSFEKFLRREKRKR
jgi:precorrin-2 dehydrogenase / sirohydrochlorin ferrochelatase